MMVSHKRGAASSGAMSRLINDHYLHRKPNMSESFEMLSDDGAVIAVCTFGTPSSRHMQISACPDDPAAVVELNRLWIDDAMPRGTASWFLSRCLKMMPPRIVVSYADTAAGHDGTVYRAANFKYAGWTDMDRLTARFDYVVPGKHSREAFRGGDGVACEKVRRKPKARYWIATGSPGERRRLAKVCGWPVMCWKSEPVPFEHAKRKACLTTKRPIPAPLLDME